MGELRYFTFDSGLGRMAVTASSKGLLTITLPQRSSPQAAGPPPEFAELVGQLTAYFEGKRISFLKYELDLCGATPFQTKVWEVTRSIPYGETRNYRWVADQIGNPEAARAVGQALGKNPLPIIIPCHRVIASDGSLGGYSGGLEMKRQLLNLERTSLSANPLLHQ